MDKSPSIIFDEVPKFKSLIEQNMFLLSTSPGSVFTDIDLAMNSYSEDESESYNDEIVKLKYKIVLKDLMIRELNKKLKYYELGYRLMKALTS